MLAAGRGIRLNGAYPPKILLEFDGKSLLARHIETLQLYGIKQLSLGVGYQRAKIDQEIASLGAGEFVKPVYNEDFLQGNSVTLWKMRDQLCCGEPVLLMDGDVLYDDRILGRLLNSGNQNSLLLDRHFSLGEEPVKVAVRDGAIVDFGKIIGTEYDFFGESVGFFCLSAHMAEAIIACIQSYLDQGHHDRPYEDAIHDVMGVSSGTGFDFEDITGLPWIEIDFTRDIEHARKVILPRIRKKLGKVLRVGVGGQSIISSQPNQ
jgi:choline kinase